MQRDFHLTYILIFEAVLNVSTFLGPARPRRCVPHTEVGSRKFTNRRMRCVARKAARAKPVFVILVGCANWLRGAVLIPRRQIRGISRQPPRNGLDDED